MHQDMEAPAPVIRVTDETTRAEIEEAMGNVVHALRRCPSHWTDRRASLHAKLDALLVDWERAPDPRTADAQAG
jgi:hypothetical protein